MADADSDALFESERLSLTLPEYEKLKEYALKSAKDFQVLYDSIPNKDATCLDRRQTYIVYDGSYGEQWSLRKVCRRFVWHDRIHAKAMWRMAVQVFGKNCIANPFYFE